MSHVPCAFGATRRRILIEAGAWGAMTALNTAFVNPMLISRGADALALGVYAGAASLFGLGTAWLGPALAARTGSAVRPATAALLAARAGLLAVPLLLVAAPEGLVPILIGVLIFTAAGEGVALPLWMAFLAGLVRPAVRGRLLADRASAAAVGAACAVLLVLLLTWAMDAARSLPAAYVIAGLAGLISTVHVRALFRRAPAAAPAPAGRPSFARPSLGFLGGVFGFWFGAALNRPVLPPYLIRDLGAPPAYFAAAAVVGAVGGVLIQPRWGQFGNTHGSRALLAVSGAGAAVVPLLWAVVPDFRLGILVEALAAGCWLGHLLGLTLRVVELAEDDAGRARAIAWTQAAQGTAAAIAPVAAALVVASVGPRAMLVASGIVCLAATGALADLLPSLPAAGAALWQRQSRLRGGAWTRMLAVARRGHTIWAWRRWSFRQSLTPDCPSCRGLGCAACHADFA